MTETTTEASRRESNRDRMRAKRLAEGRRPRTQSKAQLKPWVVAGVSRATWYRHGQPGYVAPPLPEPPPKPAPKPTPPPPDTSAVERALDLTLAALLEHRARQERQHQAQDLSPARFVLLALRKPPTRAESALQALLRDPVAHALGTALSDLGRHLFSLTGSVEGMRAVCDRVADLDPERASHRISILDAAWDGIGSGDERWWC